MTLATAPPLAPAVIAHALVIDDHPLFCDALALTLRGLLGVGRVETAQNLAAALDRIDAGPQPDLALLDLDLPDVDGLDGLLRLRAAAPDMPVLIVTSMTDPRLVAAALAAGACGFVPKHAGREAFRTAFQRLAEGERALPDGYQPPENAAADPGTDALARLAQLTRQQARILELLCQGRLNKQIAWELAIAETTVKAHVTAIMRKLGVQSRTQAVLMAQQSRFAALVPDR